MSPSQASDQELADKALREIRVTSLAQWQPNGTSVMVKVNEFDSLGKAGIQNGDEFLAVNGEPLSGVVPFLILLGKLGVGAKPTFRIRRQGVELDIVVELLKKRKLNFELDEVQVDLERKIAPA